MSDDDRPGHGPDDETTAGTGGRGHLRDGHLRAGHLRGVRGSATNDANDLIGRGGGDVDDAFVSVPDLLATDALLDRLGSHDTTDADLRDAVARLLDSYALHADPLTAGVRPVQVPDLALEVEDLPAPVPAPRVLLASRRTLRRIGHGGAAAAAVLALLGGTAAAAATGAGSIAGQDGRTGSSAAAQLPGWFPDTVFRAFGGTPEQRVEREVAQAKQEARSGDSQAAIARMTNLAKQIDASGEVDPAVAATVTQTLTALQSDVDGTAVGPTSAPAPSSVPPSPAPPTPTPGGTSLADVVNAASPTPSSTPWVPTQTPVPTTAPTGATGTATGTPGGAPGSSTSSPGRGSGSSSSSSSNPVVPPYVPPVVTEVPSGSVTTPPTVTPPPTDTPTQSPSDPSTGSPSDPGTSAAPTETTTSPEAPPSATTDPVVPPPSDPVTDTPPPVVTDPVVVVTPTLPVVVEPSPSAGAEPSPGVVDPSETASETASAGS
ncbi:hypothetical protein ACFQ46_13110 [Kineococcus sp. GCM10028916]|uniref:hypothetical protein n=1 Tax=Kineococcus sp. GCM10028916 TaxID=3273394 RepID=UPI003629C25A